MSGADDYDAEGLRNRADYLGGPNDYEATITVKYRFSDEGLNEAHVEARAIADEIASFFGGVTVEVTDVQQTGMREEL